MLGGVPCYRRSKRQSFRRAPPGIRMRCCRQMTNEFDRMFGEPLFSPSFRAFGLPAAVAWSPKVDVFEKDNRLITRVDLPGLKKEDVKVEVSDGHLALSGERKQETEEKTDAFYRSEREYRQLLPHRAASGRRQARGHQGHVCRRRPRSERSAAGARRSQGAEGRDRGTCKGGQERQDGGVSAGATFDGGVRAGASL